MKCLGLLGGLLLVFTYVNGYSLDCPCKKAHPDDTTLRGANIFDVLTGKHSYRIVNGVVLLGSTPVGDALVELFPTTSRPSDHDFYPAEQHAGRRKKACWTRKDGRFCFGKLRRGFYEIRASLMNGINVAHMYIEVEQNKSATSDEPIEIPLSLGT